MPNVNDRGLHGLIIPPGVGPGAHGRMPGEEGTVILTGAQTGGAFCMYQLAYPPGSGPHLHVHSREDESWYVLDGEFEFTVGDTTARVGAGGTGFGPRGVPHKLHPIGQGRLLVLNTPSGQEGFFEEMARLAAGGSPDQATMQRLAGKYGVTFLE